MGSQVWELLDRKGSDVIGVEGSQSVYQAVKEMADNNIGCVVVLTKAGKLSGICSERDVFRKVVLEGKSAKKVEVRDVMTPKRKLVTVTKDTTLNACMELVTDKRIRHLPVLDEAGKLTGMISIGDIVKGLAVEKEMMIQQLEHYIGSSL
jgi:CBS domain-containing protein